MFHLTPGRVSCLTPPHTFSHPVFTRQTNLACVAFAATCQTLWTSALQWHPASPTAAADSARRKPQSAKLRVLESPPFYWHWQTQIHCAAEMAAAVHATMPLDGQKGAAASQHQAHAHRQQQQQRAWAAHAAPAKGMCFFT